VCCFCDALNGNKSAFSLWANKIRTKLECLFPIPSNKIIFCALHAKLRITEKLTKLLAQQALTNHCLEEMVVVVREAGVPKFDTWIPKGHSKVKITG
jgi:hypothetical protein